MRQWALLTSAIALEVTATLSLRQALDHRGWLVLVVLGYVGAFALLAMVLRAGMPIGVAYGIWAACGVALTATLATVLFGDPMTWMIGLGIAVVIAGVLMVELGSRPTEPRAVTRNEPTR